MEPSVYWIADCEKMFLKKRDKMDTAKPAQWVNVLHKTIKVSTDILVTAKEGSASLKDLEYCGGQNMNNSKSSLILNYTLDLYFKHD